MSKEKKFLYNATFKELFLKQYNYRSNLALLAEFEKKIDKDIYAFSQQEWKQALYHLVKDDANLFKSPKSLNPYASNIKKYKEWASSKGKPVDLNWSLIDFLNAEIGDLPLEQKVENIITREQIYNMACSCLQDEQFGAQYGALLVLLFEGVDGTSHEEIILLQEKHCDFTKNTLTLTKKDGSSRTITIPSPSMRYIQLALEQKERKRGNGRSNWKDKLESDHVIRTKKGKVGFTTIDKYIKQVAETFSNVKFTSQDILESGQMDYLLLLECSTNTDMETESLLYKKVANRFGKTAWYDNKLLYLKYTELKTELANNKKQIDQEYTYILNEILDTEVGEVIESNTRTSTKNKDAVIDDGAIEEELTDIDLENIDSVEGRVVLILHLKKERKPQFIKKVKRLAKKEYGELRCEICKFNFHETYGELGEDFIEAHHAVPLSQLTKETKIKKEDIILVCSNCHRMLHRQNPCITKEELITILEMQKQTNTSI